MVRKFLSAFAVCGVLCAISAEVLADDAAVLPAGRWRVRLMGSYTEMTNKFDSSGTSVSYGSSYTKRLDTKFLSALNPAAGKQVKAMTQAMGIKGGLNFATLQTKMDTNFFTNAFVAEYGVTERLSLGVILPVVRGEVNVKADTKADKKLNSIIGSLPPAHPARIGLVTLRQSMSKQGLNETLRKQLGYSDGLKSWSAIGLGDLEIGAKYNYFKSHPLTATMKAGTRLPTGREDDPDMIFDCPFGDGQVDLAAFNYVDYQALSNLYFTFELGYTAQLPASTDVRIPAAEGLPIGAQKANVDRDLGDYYDLGLEGNFTFMRYWILSPKYHFRQKFADNYAGASAAAQALLEENTDQLLHEAQGTLEFSNLPDVRAGVSRFPIGISAFYKQPLGGENVVDARTVGMQLKTYF